jgi:DnaJ-class molecular chaperone
MEAIAAKCDACNGSGYLNGELCWKCDGNGRVVFGDIPVRRQVSRGARIMAWIAVILLIAGAAYLIGQGGR